MNQTEFLARLHENEGLSRAVLRGIDIDARSRACTFDIVTDSAYSEEDERAAAALVREAVPQSMRSLCSIHKLVADEHLVKTKILNYLDRNHRAAAACIRAEDIGVTPGDPVRFTFGVDAMERGFFEKNDGLIPDIERMLSRNFCNVFKGSLVGKEKEGIHEDAEDAEEEPFDYRPARTFPVSGFEPIDDGEALKEATCIADCTFQSEHLVVCGVIRHIQERKTQKEKPYLRFTIADATGTLSFS